MVNILNTDGGLHSDMLCFSPIDGEGEEDGDGEFDGEVDGDSEFAVIGTCRALYPFEGRGEECVWVSTPVCLGVTLFVCMPLRVHACVCVCLGKWKNLFFDFGIYKLEVEQTNRISKKEIWLIYSVFQQYSTMNLSIHFTLCFRSRQWLIYKCQCYSFFATANDIHTLTVCFHSDEGHW